MILQKLINFDPWVRGIHGSWIQSPQSQDEMVQAIPDTPLFAEAQNDRIEWMMECNKRYTVKTGYKLVMMELLHTDWFHVDGERHMIWKVNPPHKIRNLLWRICRWCVPNHLRLQSRHVQCKVICPWCDTVVKDD